MSFISENRLFALDYHSVPLVSHQGVISKMMKVLLAIFIIIVLFIGCAPSDKAHIQEVRTVLTEAGGSDAIQSESLTLFERLEKQKEPLPFLQDTQHLDGLNGIKKLGDVFHYKPSNDSYPNHVEIRRYNSHRDTYWIYLLDPQEMQVSIPEDFLQIEGNIGIITQKKLDN